MAMNKAQVFSMIAIMMSMLFIAIFALTTHVPLDKDVPVQKAEIEYVDSFVKDFDRVVINAIDRTAFDALAQFALIEQALFSPTQDFDFTFNNFTQSMQSCFESTQYTYNSDVGLVNCTRKINATHTKNFSFSHYLDVLFAKAEFTYGVEIDYGSITARVYQGSTPYRVGVDVSMKVFISRDDYEWARHINVTREVDVNGIDHPLIPGRKIMYRPVAIGDSFTSQSFNLNVTLLSEYIQNGYYFKDETAPSLFDLFNGNISETGGFTNNEYGITSLLPADQLYFNNSQKPYVGNTSSSREYDFLKGNSYNPNDLYHVVNVANISVNQTIPGSLLNTMGFSNPSSEPNFEIVAGNCDSNGCD